MTERKATNDLSLVSQDDAHSVLEPLSQLSTLRPAALSNEQEDGRVEDVERRKEQDRTVSHLEKKIQTGPNEVGEEYERRTRSRHVDE